MAGLDDKYKLYEERFQKRRPDLEKLGFSWNEARGIFLRDDYSIYWERVVCDNDEEWEEHLIFINDRIIDKL